MSGSRSPLWNVGQSVRLERKDPYLLLQHVTIFVADQERGLRFFVDSLGFRVVLDYRAPAAPAGGTPTWPVGERLLTVAPPDGTARLALVAPAPGSEDHANIGKGRRIVFLTEDVEAKYREWSARGVHFLDPPGATPFEGKLARFEDPDGNRFSLVEVDQFTRQLEEQRRLTEEHQEFERRAARELEIARQVQARLFPQRKPEAQTLEYAGACIQARQVGGDYYDYLDLGRGRIGLVVGDIAGKGIAAALLMANLQANLRSQSATASSQPEQFLRSVNQLFYENTADGDYASFFFSDYDDATRKLRYANCGHLPAILLRRDGALERLASTSTVLGLFDDWDCVLQERRLCPGDTLLLYTDGVIESPNDSGEEFGEARLVDALRRHRALPSETLIAALVDEVRQFNRHEQQDDITLIVATCR
jgi:serine phosphatase RsbU (regulator of sigma subunit)